MRKDETNRPCCCTCFHDFNIRHGSNALDSFQTRQPKPVAVADQHQAEAKKALLEGDSPKPPANRDCAASYRCASRDSALDRDPAWRCDDCARRPTVPPCRWTGYDALPSMGAAHSANSRRHYWRARLHPRPPTAGLRMGATRLALLPAVPCCSAPGWHVVATPSRADVAPVAPTLDKPAPAVHPVLGQRAPDGAVLPATRSPGAPTRAASPQEPPDSVRQVMPAGLP